MNSVRLVALAGRSTLKATVAAAALLVLTGAAQAGLVFQANGVEVLDTDTNLLWLYNWNSSGSKNWADAKTWAAGLTVGGATAGDWRLPEIGEYLDLWTDPDRGTSLAGVQQNLYWSGTVYAPSPTSAWLFNPVGNISGPGTQNLAYLAVAVRPSDVTAAVPEPQTLALALLALGATVVVRRKQSS